MKITENKIKLRGISELNGQIRKVMTLLDKEEVGTERYDELLEYLERLYDIKKDHTVNKTTMVGGVLNLTGIILVLNYEQFNIITSKAFGMVKRV